MGRPRFGGAALNLLDIFLVGQYNTPYLLVETGKKTFGLKSILEEEGDESL